MIDTTGDANHAVIITGCWIYDSNLQNTTSFDKRITGYYLFYV